MRKNLFVSIGLSASLLLAASPVMAQGLGARITAATTRLENQASAVAQRQSNTLSSLQKRADMAITNRVNDLNKLLTRIQNDKRLSSGEKSSLSAEVQSSITGLTSLKAKIDADMDLATAQADSKQIVTGYRVYLVVNPQTQLLIIIDNLQVTTANVQTLTPQLQNLINTLKSQGKDVTSMQASLDDINAQLQAVTTKLAADKTTISSVTVSTSNPQATFTSVRQDLSGVRADFAKIRSDLAQMRSSFQIIIKGGNSGNPSTPSAKVAP